jgi:Na+(H+)/acetate symporter ActP
MSNVGTIDRIVRAVAGLALIILPFLAAWPIVAVIISVVLGLVLVTTAAVSFCPIYAALGMSSKGTRHPAGR